MAQKEKQFDSEKAKQLLLEEEANRIEVCSREIEAVLKKYKCGLDVTMILRENGCLPQVKIVSSNVRGD